MAAEKPDTTHFATYVEPDFAERFKALAASHDRSVAAEIRQALRNHLAEHEADEREAA